jgi:hypothetical protein
VSWQGFTATSSYTFVLNGDEATPTTQLGMSATFSGLVSGTQYSITVTAVNSKGSASSASVTVTTLGSPPTEPVLSVSNITTSTAQINWTGGDGATSYSYTLNGTATAPVVDSGLVSKFIVFSNLTSSVTYTLVVTATNDTGSTSSDVISLTTLYVL